MNNTPSCLIEETCGVIDPSLRFGPPHLTSPLYGIVFPLLTLITTISNSIIINILLRKNMKSPTNIMLASIAAFDMASLLPQVPWHFYMFTLENFSLPFLTTELCYIMELCVEILPYMCHTTANWLTLGLSAQRYVYICRPHMTKQWCTVKTSTVGIILAFVLALAHVVSRAVDRNYSIWEIGDNPVCIVKLSHWVQYITPNVYFNCFFWFKVIFVQSIPCILVTIFNGCLLNALRKAKKVQASLLSKNPKLKKTNKTTTMLIVLNVVFLLVEIPMSILIMLHTISSSFYEFLDYNLAKLLVLIFNFLIILSYPINFGIYCSLSSQFLAAFRSLIYKSKLFMICSRFHVFETNSKRKQYKRCSSQTQDTTI